MVAPKYIITNVCSKGKVRYYRNQKNMSLEEGIHFALIKLIQNGLITMKDAAVHFNMSESEFQKLIENNETTEFN